MQSFKTLGSILFLIYLAIGQPQFAYSSKMDSLFTVYKNEKDPVKKADVYLNYVNILSKTNRDSAIQLLKIKESEYDKSGFKYGLGRTLSIHAWYVIFLSQYEESLKIGHKALKIQKAIHDSEGIALTLNRIGLANLNFKRYKDAENYILQSYNYFIWIKDSSKIDMLLNNLGVICEEQKNYPKAIDYFRKSLHIRLIHKQFSWVGFSYFNIGNVFLHSNSNLDSAQYYFLKAEQTFANKTPKKAVPPMVTLGLADLFRQQKDYTKALEYAKVAIRGAEKENHTEIIVMAKEILAEVLSKLKRYEEAFTIQTELIELKATIDSTNNATSVAEIEEKYKNAEKETEIAKLKAEKLENENKLQTLKLYAITSIAFFILLAALVIILWQRRNQKEKIKELNLNAKIAEAKMFALRAQMNPHFIFNCINTAQNFVVTNQREQAFEYLSNFAKLLRLVLENSSTTFVPIEDEITQIKLYIELEAIRFNNKFKYELIVDEDLKSGIYEIPGMVLQPIIENAIGHGLINRKDDLGELVIHLRLQDETLVCEITDNGVGREKALEIKAAKNIRYQSTAIPNIQERLKMLQSETSQKIDLRIIDLAENGVSTGTKAILTLPIH